MQIEIQSQSISVSQYKELRTAVGWPLPPDSAIKRSLENTEYCITASANGELAGMGRIVGDKGFVYFIADIIVKPEYQGNKIGSGIMENIVNYLKKNAPENSYITLMAAKGKESFYEKFGFFRRPSEKFGSGMMIEL